MDIALCTDANYFMPAGITMISICENHRNVSIVFHIVLADDVSESSAVELQRIAERYHQQIVFYHLGDRLSNLHSSIEYISPFSYARLFLAEVIPTSVHQVIYLDCDIVVLGSLLPMWNVLLDDNQPLGACMDIYAFSVLHHNQIGLPLDIPYFNAGVLLINLDYWRQNPIASQMIEYVHEAHPTYMDQDAINHVLAGRILRLNSTFNMQVPFLTRKESQWMVTLEYKEEIREASQDPVIIHYVTYQKPWMDICPFQEKWLKYYEMSVWKGVPLKHCVLQFEDNPIYRDLVRVYWAEPTLFDASMRQFLRYYENAVHFRNKKRILQVGDCWLRLLSRLLEWVYRVKTR